MHAVGTWEPGFGAYRRARFAVPGTERGLWLTRGAGGLLLAIDALLLLFGVRLAAVATELLAGAAIACARDVLLVVEWRRVRAGGGTRFEISDAGIDVHSGATLVRTHWKALPVRRILRHAWLFRSRAGGTLVVPRAVFEPDDAAAVDAWLYEGGPVADAHTELAVPPVSAGSRHFVGELAVDFGGYRRIYQATSGGRGWTTRGLVFAGAAVLTLLLWPAAWGGYYLSLAVGPLAVIGYEAHLLRHWHRVKAETDRPWTYDVTETRVVVRTPFADTTFRWDTVVAVREHADAWLFKLRGGTSIPIPKAAFQPSESAHIELLVDYWGLTATR